MSKWLKKEAADNTKISVSIFVDKDDKRYCGSACPYLDKDSMLCKLFLNGLSNEQIGIGGTEYIRGDRIYRDLRCEDLIK